jgi:serine phosphatase RsbU (regulator of sigma subunit)
MSLKKNVLFANLLFITVFITAQNQVKIDSLNLLFKKSNSTYQKAIILSEIAIAHKGSSPDSAINIIERSLKFALTTPDSLLIARIWKSKASFILWKERHVEAKGLINQAIRIFKNNNKKLDLAWCYYQLANAERSTSNIEQAITNLFIALKLFEEIDFLEGQANCFGLLADIYGNKKEKQKALDYALKELKINKARKSDRGISHALTDVGIAYLGLKKYKEAEECFKTSNTYKKKTGDSLGVAVNLTNLASVYLESNQFQKSIASNNAALKIFLEAKSDFWSAVVFANLAETYYKIKDFKNAEEACLVVIKKAKPINFLEVQSGAYQILSKIQAAKGDYKNALKNYQDYAVIKDSVLNETTLKQIQEVSVKYDTEKKDREISLLNKDKALNQAVISNQQLEAEKSRAQKLLLFGGLFVMLFFVWFAYSRLQLTKKQKTQIEKQKSLVDEKQKEILDSIAYAKRLQDAILPTQKQWTAFLSDSFILYLPKDIVAGDFYWLEKTKDVVFFAVADCTGHGVPGALVSVVCSNALNRSVLEFNITDPGKILDKTRELVIATFEKSDQDVKDGMDISLCALNTKTKELSWAGANNPLWYFQNNQLNQLKANKQPIGKHSDEEPFTTHKMQLNNGDKIFLFSDGIADQFGGQKGKKFKHKQLGEFLLSNVDLPMETQKQKLQDTFEQWRGQLEQVDDVCVIGVKI